MNYGLYQTLDYDTPKKDMRSSDKKLLTKNLLKLDDSQKEAVLLLICEHARINDDYIWNNDENTLPYNLKYDKIELMFDVNELPIKLKWILNKFIDVIGLND